MHHPAHPPLLDPSDARDNVGGYDDYPELYTRWFEYGTFLPIMRTHGSRNAQRGVVLRQAGRADSREISAAALSS